MRTVLRSDFVNRNKVVIASLTLELRAVMARIVDFRLAPGIRRKGDIAREAAVVFAAESWSVSNICMVRK